MRLRKKKADNQTHTPTSVTVYSAFVWTRFCMYGWVSVMWCGVMLPIQKYILQVTEYSRVRRVGWKFSRVYLLTVFTGPKTQWISCASLAVNLKSEKEKTQHLWWSKSSQSSEKLNRNITRFKNPYIILQYVILVYNVI